MIIKLPFFLFYFFRLVKTPARRGKHQRLHLSVTQFVILQRSAMLTPITNKMNWKCPLKVEIIIFSVVSFISSARSMNAISPFATTRTRKHGRRKRVRAVANGEIAFIERALKIGELNVIDRNSTHCYHNNIILSPNYLIIKIMIIMIIIFVANSHHTVMRYIQNSKTIMFPLPMMFLFCFVRSCLSSFNVNTYFGFGVYFSLKCFCVDFEIFVFLISLLFSSFYIHIRSGQWIYTQECGHIIFLFYFILLLIFFFIPNSEHIIVFYTIRTKKTPNTEHLAWNMFILYYFDLLCV